MTGATELTTTAEPGTPGIVLSSDGLAVSPRSARVVAQFSCGAASAVATKLAIAEYGDRVALKVTADVRHWN